MKVAPMARKYYWRGGLGANVSIPIGTTGGASGVPGQQVGASRVGHTDVLTRVRVQGRFMVQALGNGTTNNPSDAWGLGLEAWVGLWADGGDPTLTVPIDPFDTPDPDPPWVWTAFLQARPIVAATVPKTYLYTLDIPAEVEWASTKRDTVFAHGGDRNQLWLQWVIDATTSPFIDTTSGGVQYRSGMNIDVRSLWLKE